MVADAEYLDGRPFADRVLGHGTDDMIVNRWW